MQLTIIVAIINVIVFFALSFGGMTESASYMLEHGAMYVPYVIENGEYFRFFTCMFLHFSFSHLINNMVTLVLVGRNVELTVGKIRFLIIYLLSGLGGSVVSLVGELVTGDFVVSAGASGAIFGLTGALLALALMNRGRAGQFSLRDMIIMIALSLYLGFTSQGVDNLAHIGGLVSGFLITLLVEGLPKCMSRHQS